MTTPPSTTPYTPRRLAGSPIAWGGICLAGAAAYLLHPGTRSLVNETVRLAARADLEPVRDWVLGFGALAPIASAVLQLVTSVFAPLPSFILAFVNAMVFGFAAGALLTFVTALAASAVCFGLARALGRPAVERLVTGRLLTATDRFFVRHGAYAVIVARLIPFVNPDAVSYAAGLTPMRWPLFLFSIALGSIPSTLLYSYLGARGVTEVGWLLAPLVGLGLLTLIVALVRSRRHRDVDPDRPPPQPSRADGTA